MIRILMADLADSETECLVRSISSELEPDTPVSRDLGLRAGDAVLDRLRGMGSLPVGAAAITPGGELKAPFLIHVVLQGSDQPVQVDIVKAAMVNGLRRAQEFGLGTLATPVLGVGAGNLSAEESAEAMIPVIGEHLRRYENPREVLVVVSNDYEEDVFLKAVELAGRHAAAPEN